MSPHLLSALCSSSKIFSAHQNLLQKPKELGARAFKKIYPGKSPETVWGVGSQCVKYKQLYVQDPIPEPQDGTPKRISQERQRNTFYMENITRPSYKNLLGAS